MSGRRACSAFFALLLTLNVLEASFKVSINPRHVRINKTLESVTFTCNVGLPLTGCQFHFLSSLNEQNTPLDCSEGKLTKNFRASLPKGVQETRYTGNGLDKGQCGITFKTKVFHQWVVGCRVKAEQGSWQYAFTDLYARDDFLDITANPETSIVRPGHKLSVMCSIPNYPLFSCSFSIKGFHKDNEIDFNSGMASPESRYPHFYQGTGLKKGQCGITLHNVSDRHNGPGFCRLNDDDDAQGVGFFTVVVAVPPDKPVLRLDVISLENGLINATCFVNGGRPAPHIRWLLGGKTLRHDEIDDTDASLEDGWMWPWNLTSTTQNLVYELKPDDEGKVLMCIVSHVALVKPLDAIRRIPSKITSRLDETVEVTTTSTPKKNPTCHRLTSMTVDISCVYQSNPVPCNIKAKLNTKALATCKEGFAAINDETNRSMTCQDTGNGNGKWSRKLLVCKDEGCGELSNIVTYIEGGEIADTKNIPWQIGIYMKASSTRWIHICGGTLIHMKYVLSAAHCFWDKISKKLQNESLFMVTAGKAHREYHTKDDINTQQSMVVKIHVPEQYRGGDTNHHFDIALLKLKHRMKLDANVRVVCTDTSKEDELRTPGREGTVAGWGVADDGNPSPILQAVSLPYVSYTKCVDGIKPDMRRWLTYDKFCAGYKDQGISVCKGDSGGGLIFQGTKSERFYLLGIVSINFAPGDQINCYAKDYTAFTDVSLHYDWFTDVIASSEK